MKTSEIFKEQSVFRSICEAAVEGILLVDEQGKILSINKAGESMFGYNHDEILGSAIEKLVPLKFQFIHKKYRELYTKNPTPRNIGTRRNFLGLKKDGSEFPVEISLSYTKVKGFFVLAAFTIDITERKNAEREIIETNRKFQTLIGNLPGVAYRCKNHPTWEMEFISDYCEAITGYKATDFYQNKVRTWASIIHPEDRSIVYNQTCDAVTKKEPFQIIYRIITKSQDERLVWEQGKGIEINGEISTLEGFIQDITHQSETEKALKKSKEELSNYASKLEENVEERRNQLHQTVDKLETANSQLQNEIWERKQAEENTRKALEKEKGLNELKSRFVTMASHEFRTPLSTVLSSALLISKYKTTELDDKRIKHVNRIKSSVNYLTNILDDFLSLDKLEEGKLDLSISLCDLHTLTAEVIDEISLSKKERDIKFNVEGELRMIESDHRLLRNIIVNLLSNAKIYSLKTSVINVSLIYQKENVILTVADQGIGIPYADQIHLFDRFFRAGNVTNIQGTGLGLNLVKKYLELLNGKITFSSEPGNGTVFNVEFPIKQLNHEKNTIN